ncbi:MAG: polysaccharide biosynthesis protein [Armatimonadetes bacterium]|nr:polysaccharide biosynthesis protein [Armatimonadota bacterium]
MTTRLFLRVRYTVPVDALCILLAFVLSVAIRFEPAALWPVLLAHQGLLWLSLAIRLPTYALFGLYHRLWAYASTRELVSIVVASAVSSLTLLLALGLLLPWLGGYPGESRTLLALDGILNLALLSSTRLALRLAQEQAARRHRKLPPMFVSTGEMRRVLVVGAGDAGARIIREMQLNPESGLLPVAVVDDARAKQHMRVHGTPVVGTCDDLATVVERFRIQEVIIAIPSAPGTTIQALRRACVQARVPFRVIPSIHEMLDGRSPLQHLRAVSIEDLLRRDPVVTDLAGVRAYLAGKCILVTGAGGSIGSELCRQIAGHCPSRLLLLGHGEHSIFNIERELRRRFPEIPVQPIIADVRDEERVEGIVARYQPGTIFHAAAHKHVPLMEANVTEAFTNNVLGTQCVLRAAERHGVERFVLISSDKAVNPTSVMGATKRVAELLVYDAALRTGRPFVAVRFGNVLGSRGSVVPIFQEQIAAGGPVTVTHPDMRRYFMTIPEAVQLVLQAAALGHGGEVFMLDMGEPVRILDLATYLIELSGLSPKEDIAIQFTGLRPGEKLYEELALDSEHYRPTAHQKILVCHSNARPVATGDYLERGVAAAARFARALDNEAVLGQLLDLVPEFQSGQRAPAPPPASS